MGSGTAAFLAPRDGELLLRELLALSAIDVHSF